MANSVIVRQETADESDEYWKCFPPFLWLLRDMHLKIPERNGRQLTPTEYLKTVVLGDDDSKSMKAAVRKSLNQFFPSFECKTLPIPSKNETAMVNVSKNLQEPDSSFNQGVEELIAFVKQNIPTKQVFAATGAKCDGSTFALFVKKITEAINVPHSVLTVDITWKTVVESRCKAAQEKLLQEYSSVLRERYDEISKGRPLEVESLMKIHDTLWSDIKVKLHDEVSLLLTTKDCTLKMVTDQLERQLIMFDKEASRAGVKKVVGGVIFPLLEENRNRSSKFCNEIISKLYAPIRRRVQTTTSENTYTPEQLAADVKSLLEEYDAKSVGPEKWNVRAQMEATIEQNDEFFHKVLHVVSQHAKKEREQKQMLECLQSELRELNENKRQMDGKFDEFTKQQKEADERRQQQVEREVNVLREKLEQQKQKEEDRKEKEMNQRMEANQRLTEETVMRERAEEKLKDIEDTLENNKKEESIRKARADEEIKKMQQSVEENKMKEAEREQIATKEIDDLKARIKEWEQQIKQKQIEQERQKAEADNKIRSMEKSLFQQKERESEEGIKQERQLREKQGELHEQQLVIEKMKADHELTVYKANAEKEEEKRLKEQAKEEARTTINRLNQVIEEEKVEKEAQTLEWKKQFSQKEKEKADLSGRIDTLNFKVDALAEEKETLTKEKEDLVEEKEGLVEEKETLTKEKEDLVEEKEGLVEEKETLTKEKEDLVEEKETLTKEKEDLVEEKEGLVEEKETLTKEKEDLVEEKETLTKEKEDLFEEKEGLIEEKETLTEEKDDLLKDIDEFDQKPWYKRVLTNPKIRNKKPGKK